jgi:hypothetical protein
MTTFETGVSIEGAQDGSAGQGLYLRLTKACRQSGRQDGY